MRNVSCLSTGARTFEEVGREIIRMIEMRAKLKGAELFRGNTHKLIRV